MTAIANTPALKLTQSAAWLWAALFVAGNVLLPRLCHMVPDGGKMFLPIMLFTLVATVRFGLWCGMVTALASPMVSVLLFGSPSGVVLTSVILKSVIIALVFGLWKQYRGGFSAVTLLGLILAVQLGCFALEGGLLAGWAESWRSLLISWPGVALQWVAALLALKYWK